jgi:hypothetical protein
MTSKDFIRELIEIQFASYSNKGTIPPSAELFCAWELLSHSSELITREGIAFIKQTLTDTYKHENPSHWSSNEVAKAINEFEVKKALSYEVPALHSLPSETRELLTKCANSIFNLLRIDVINDGPLVTDNSTEAADERFEKFGTHDWSKDFLICESECCEDSMSNIGDKLYSQATDAFLVEKGFLHLTSHEISEICDDAEKVIRVAELNNKELNS